MKKKLKILFTTLLMIFLTGNISFADVVMPGERPGNHGIRRDVKYEMIEEVSIWKFILIGITIIAIVNVIILIICKKMKKKKENKNN